MAPVYYAIGFSGLVLEFLIIWRALSTSHWQRFPYFFAYILFAFVRAVALYVLMRSHHAAYATIYWQTNVISLLLFFLVPWEISRHTFTQSVTLRWIVGLALLLVLTSLSSATWLVGQGLGNFYADLERKLSFAQAACMATILLLARLYSISLGRNIWWLALGFGVYTSISVMNFSLLDLLPSVFPYWQFVRPVTFNVMLAVWLWALWVPAPEPDWPLVPEEGLIEWTRAWVRIRTVLRKVIFP